MKNETVLIPDNDLPNAIDCQEKLKGVNPIISIYKGDYIIKDGNNEIKVVGEISYFWFPSSGVYFSGKIPPNIDMLKVFNKKGTINIIIDSLDFGAGFLTSIELGRRFKGVMQQTAILGDNSIEVEKTIFVVPNLKDILGLPIKKINSEIEIVSKGRILLTNDKYIIKLDKLIEFKRLKDQLKENGGYSVLYVGELNKINASISLAESQKILFCLSTFLTFINGRRISSMFLAGKYKNEDVWQDFTDYHNDEYKNAISWYPWKSFIDINGIWKNFNKLWDNDMDKDFIKSAIHWYISANNQQGGIDGAIIMAQTALELLYNWWIVENKRFIIGKDSENIQASNKIRLLLSQINIDLDIPYGFKKLKEFIDSENQIIDAPDVIVQIRNAIVHSQVEKRKKLESISHKARYEALELSLWYIELILLKILGHNDKYVNRTSKEQYESKTVEYVPWKKPNH